MLAELKLKHREIARLNFEGFKPADISAKTGVGLQTVYKILRDPICQAYVNGLADRVDKTSLDVRERLMKLNQIALDRFEDILDVDSKAPYSVIATIGRDVLDRTGHKASEKLDISMTLQGKSDEEIDAQIASLKSQLDATYNADLTASNNDASDEEDSLKASDDPYASNTTINPLTDCKES